MTIFLCGARESIRWLQHRNDQLPRVAHLRLRVVPASNTLTIKLSMTAGLQLVMQREQRVVSIHGCHRRRLRKFLQCSRVPLWCSCNSACPCSSLCLFRQHHWEHCRHGSRLSWLVNLQETQHLCLPQVERVQLCCLEFQVIGQPLKTRRLYVIFKSSVSPCSVRGFVQSRVLLPVFDGLPQLAHRHASRVQNSPQQLYVGLGVVRVELCRQPRQASNPTGLLLFLTVANASMPMSHNEIKIAHSFDGFSPCLDDQSSTASLLKNCGPNP